MLSNPFLLTPSPPPPVEIFLLLDPHKPSQALVMEFTTHTNFVVAYFPQISATKLKIPGHFAELQEFVTLRDKYKNTWEVKARKVDGHWYLLDDGWAKFVADSSVTMMDVLDFHYFGPSSLEVYILDIHGDVKKGVGYRKIDNPIEYLKMKRDESEHVYTSARMSLGKGKKLTKFNRGKAKGSTSRPAPAPKIPSSAAKPPRRMNDTNNKGKGIMKESSDEDSDSNSDSDSDFWPYDYDEISEDDIVSWISGLENSKKHKLKARGAKVPKRAKHGSGKFDYLGHKIFKSGVIPRPTCTYFVTKMKPATPDELHIPKEIVRDENLQLQETITLADPKGNAYRSSSLTSRTDGVMIHKGG